MKLNYNFTLTGLGGEYVAVPLDGGDDFHGIVKLNESGAEVFRGLSEGQDEKQIARRLMEKYPGLDTATADKAVSVVIEQLREAGLTDE